MTTYRVGDIQPNPFRRMDRFPLNNEHVEDLRAKIRSTGFWDNVVARINQDGKPELAHGHHRHEALLREYGPNHRVGLIVRDLDDATMIRMMVDENGQSHQSNFAVQLESVRTVLEQAEAGKIDLLAGLPKPSGGRPAKSKYTAKEISNWLNGTLSRETISSCLDVLGAEQEGLEPDVLDDISTFTAREIVSTAKAKVKADPAKKVSKEIAKLATENKAGVKTWKDIRDEGQATRAKVSAQKKPIPGIREFASDLTSKINQYGAGLEQFREAVSQIGENTDQLYDEDVYELGGALTEVIDSAVALLHALGCTTDIALRTTYDSVSYDSIRMMDSDEFEDAEDAVV